MRKIYLILFLSVMNLYQNTVLSSEKRVSFVRTQPTELSILTVLPVLNALPPELQNQCRELITPNKSIVSNMVPQPVYEYIMAHPEEFEIVVERIFLRKKETAAFKRTFLLIKEIHDGKIYYMLSPELQSELDNPLVLQDPSQKNFYDYAEIPNVVYDYISTRRNDFAISASGCVIPAHGYRYYKHFLPSKTELSNLTVFCCDTSSNNFINRTLHDLLDNGIEWIHQFRVKLTTSFFGNIDDSKKLTVPQEFVDTQIIQGLGDFMVCGQDSTTNQIDNVVLDFSEIHLTTHESVEIPPEFRVVWPKPTQSDKKSPTIQTVSTDSSSGLCDNAK